MPSVRSGLRRAFHSAAELLAHCAEQDLRISDVMFENEKAWRSEDEIRSGLLKIWKVMQTCVKNGCRNEGILPGGMKVKRRAAELYRKLNAEPGITYPDLGSIIARTVDASVD